MRSEASKTLSPEWIEIHTLEEKIAWIKEWAEKNGRNVDSLLADLDNVYTIDHTLRLIASL